LGPKIDPKNSKSNGNLVAFYIKPITACLLDLIEDDEFNVDFFGGK
jgi:hypothetical protein